MPPTSAAARGLGLRPLRAGVFAAVCVVTTALGHALMSGDLLPWWVPGAAFTGTGTAPWWLTARERGALTVAGAATGVQALLYLRFDLAHMVVRCAACACGEAGRLSTGWPGPLPSRCWRPFAASAVCSRGRVAARRSGAARPVAATVQAPPVTFAVLRHAVIRRGPPRAGSAAALAGPRLRRRPLDGCGWSGPAADVRADALSPTALLDGVRMIPRSGSCAPFRCL